MRSRPHRKGTHARRIVEAVETVLLGKREAVETAVTTLVAGGHLLLEDVPGVGKTMLGRALAVAIGGSFSRIQFTSDLLPADIVGSAVFSPASSRFEIRKGPLFAHVVLADDQLRYPARPVGAPRVPGERCTIDRESFPRAPLFVIATQTVLLRAATAVESQLTA
jgi:MoxR-like ATPase